MQDFNFSRDAGRLPGVAPGRNVLTGGKTLGRVAWSMLSTSYVEGDSDLVLMPTASGGRDDL